MNDSEVGRVANGRELCAIVVTFHPDSELPVRLASVLRQVAALVIVDNGSGNAEIKIMRELAASPLVTLVLNLENLGIARALNIGVQHALTHGYKWILLLDQDSRVDDDMVEILFAAHAAFPDRDRLAVVGSGFRAINANSPLPGPTDTMLGNGWEEVESVITSGSLISLKTHAAVGAFSEEFYIDYVDTEYCFRARAKGFRVIRTTKTIMSHAIGAITQHSIFGIKKWTFNHSVDRHYYIARNGTVLLRQYGHYFLGLWALKSFGRSIRACKRIALYEQMKTRKLLAVADGWRDGVRGHMGPRVHRQSKKR